MCGWDEPFRYFQHVCRVLTDETASGTSSPSGHVEQTLLGIPEHRQGHILGGTFY